MTLQKLALACCVLLPASSAVADNLSWSFQRTGFRTTQSIPQTALSMRNDLSWPVVYAVDQTGLGAYSLFPVLNPQVPVLPATNWHQIGSNLTGSFVPSSQVFLQAASGSPDGFAVSLQTPLAFTTSPPDTVAIGTSPGGFQSPMTGAQAVKFGPGGVPFTASAGTIPGLTPSQKIFDVAVSRFGEIGAVTQSSAGSGVVTFWQQSPLLAGRWFSTPISLPQNEGLGTLYGATVDLSYDTSGRPHIVGLDRINITNNRVMAHRFDITTGLWVASTLDTAAIGPPIADVASASNDHGVVGAAWVNNGTLKYAYLDANDPTPNWVVTTVPATLQGEGIELSQGVGLAYDKAGLPVISFVQRGSRQIWIAYDPPAATGVPSLPGDFNGDGFVDGGDLDQWKVGVGEESVVADANGDGHTDGSDFIIWQRNLGAGRALGAAAATAAVPEPASLAITLVAASFVCGASRRRTAQSKSTTTFAA